MDSNNAIHIFHRCGGCGKKREFVNSGKFRVNARAVFMFAGTKAMSLRRYWYGSPVRMF